MNADEVAHERSSVKHSVWTPNGVKKRYLETIKDNKLCMRVESQTAASQFDYI